MSDFLKPPSVAPPVPVSAMPELKIEPITPPASTLGVESDSSQPKDDSRNPFVSTPERDALNLQKDRLVIEKDPGTGRFIYKTVNAETGKVVAFWPLEKLLEQGQSEGPGALLNTLV